MTIDSDSAAEKELLSILKNKGVSLLARREHSRYELREKLLKSLPNNDCGQSEHLIDEALEWVVDMGYLDEQRYADMVLRSRVAKGYGAQRVRQELSQKRVAPEIVQASFESCDVDWYELAKSVFERRFVSVGESAGESIGENVSSLERAKLKAKQQRFLYGRGFSSDEIQYAIDG